MSTERTDPALYSVDRFEGDVAVLIDETGASMDVNRSRLPDGAEPGSVIRVWPSDVSGDPDWSSAELAEDEVEARLEEGREILEELKKRDPGGDVVL